MTREEVTLLAAIMAALMSLLSLVVMVKQKYHSELREAQRTTLEKYVVGLGNEIWSVVAMSKRMGLADDNQKYLENKVEAVDSSRNLDKLRRDTRYCLWGLNDGLHYLVLLPRWVEALRGSNLAVIELIDAATDLREAIDNAIKNSYQNGTPPSKASIQKIESKISEVRRVYDRHRVGASDVGT